MKILYLITQGEQGGAQKNVADIALALSRDSRYDIHVATGRQYDTKDIWLQETLIQKGFNDAHIHEIKNLAREVRLFTKDIKAFFELYFFIKKNKFDIVHLHSTKAGMLGSCAGKLARAKTVYTVHGFVMKEPMNIFKKCFYTASELLGSLFIDKYICVSKQDLNIGQTYKIIRGNKGFVIYNGINLQDDYFLSKEIAKQKMFEKISSLRSDTDMIVTIANLYKTKGIEYLIRAAYTLEHTYDYRPTLVVIGEGEERARLEGLQKELDVTNVFLIGAIPEAARYLKAFDLYVAPSIKEGLPYAPIEAAAASLPIIATDVGGMPEIAKVIPMNLVQASDGDALAKAIATKRHEEYRVATPEQVHHFSLNTMIEKTTSVYNSLYAKHN